MIPLSLLIISFGQEYYGLLLVILDHILIKLILAGSLFTLTYHLLNGIRHIFWDMGYGLDIKDSYISGYLVILFHLSDNYYFINVYVGYMYINHWKIQRLSAIILVPAMFYLIYYLINLSNLSYNDVITDLSSLTGVLYVVLLSFVLFMHSSSVLKRFLKTMFTIRIIRNFL